MPTPKKKTAKPAKKTTTKKTKKKVTKHGSKQITKDMAILDILQKHPETAEVFLSYGIHCIGCIAAAYETLEQGLEMHGIEVNGFTKKLNEMVGKAK